MVCLVCEECSEKYKCPVCRLPYCGVECWKKHKESDLCKPPEPSKDEKVERQSSKSYHYPTEHTIPEECLQRLAYSKDLKDVLANPHLRAMLTAIDSSPDPSISIRTAMLEPIFVEFADIALKTMEL